MPLHVYPVNLIFSKFSILPNCSHVLVADTYIVQSQENKFVDTKRHTHIVTLHFVEHKNTGCKKK